MPVGEAAYGADPQSCLASGCAAGLGLADMERIADQVASGGVEGTVNQSLRIAGEQRSQRGEGGNTGLAKAAQNGKPFPDGSAEGFIETADVLPVGGEGEADA